MTDRPIIFSAPMVRALLDGRKTQTRRVLKPQPHERAKGCYHRPNGSWVWVDAHRENNGVGYFGNRLDDSHFFTRYAPGDRLWVRETWSAIMNGGWTIADARMRMFDEKIVYRADGHEDGDGWWPSIHMPREFSRLTLIVTDVRVHRLQEISEADAVAEGALQSWTGSDPESDTRTALNEFEALWNSIHGPEAWAANPWVVAVSFAVRRCNIDRMEARND